MAGFTSLPERPSLRQLKDQAADLRRAFAYGEPEAEERVQAALPRLVTGTDSRVELQVSHALFVIAREYGFESWPDLKRHIETATDGNTSHKENIMATPQEIEVIKQKIRRAATEDFTNPGYLAKCLLACEAAEAPGFTDEDYKRIQAEFDWDIKEMIPLPGSGKKVDWDKLWAGTQEYLELAARVDGYGWWSGFGATKHLRAVQGLNAGDILAALQSLDSYVLRLKPLGMEHAVLVNAIAGTRGLVAIALGKALEATGKLALAKGADQGRKEQLQQEAGALTQEATDLVTQIKGRVEEVRKLGASLETLKH